MTHDSTQAKMRMLAAALTSTPPKSVSVKRQLEKEFASPVADFSTQVGQVIWAHNFCHAAFSRLFAVLVSVQNLAIGFNIWHKIMNDSTQRDLVMAAAEAALAKNKSLLRRVEWAKQAADKLGKHRNDIVHLATGFNVSGSAPSLTVDSSATQPKRVRRLKNQDLDKMMRHLQGDLIALGQYVNHLFAMAAFPGKYPSPRRPQLRSDLGQKRK